MIWLQSYEKSSTKQRNTFLFIKIFLIVLHRAAVKTTMLADDRTTVDAHNIAVRERLANGMKCFCVEVGLGVGRHQNGTVDNQIVSVGCWQTIVAIIDRTGQRQLQETVRASVHGAKSLQLLFHEGEVRMVVVAPSI